MDNTVSSMFLRNPEAAAALRRQQLAAAMMQRAQGQGPMLGPMSVLGSAGQTLAAAMMNRGAEQDLAGIGERQRAQEAATKAEGDALIQQIMGQLGGGEGGQAPPASPPMSTLPPVARGAPGKMGAMAPPAELMPHFQQAAAENRIPLPALLAQAQQESGFNPNAVGRAGEIGVMQVMPSTARSPGFGVEPVDPAALRDPAANISFGAKYLRGRAGPNADLSNPNALATALRSYNGGGDPNYVQNVRQHMPGAGGAIPGASAPMRGDATGNYVGGEAAGAPAGRGGPDMRTVMTAAMSDDPRLQRLAPLLGAMLRRENPAPRAPVTVSPGSSIVDPQTGKVIYSSPRDQAAEPLVQVAGPDGQPVWRPRSQAMGMQAYVPERQPPPLLSPEKEAQEVRLKEAGRPSTTVVNQAENQFGKSLAGASTDVIKERQQQALIGRDAVESAERIEGLLRSGAITGTGAAWRTSLERGAATLGLIDGERVSNTEQLIAEQARSVLPLAQSLKGPTSDRDITFLQDAAAGKISVTPETIRRMADIQRRYGTRAVEDWNKVSKAIGEEPGATGASRAVFAPVELQPRGDAAPTQNPMAQNLPKQGDVVSGYRFRGGNPNDRNSWEPVK